MVITFFGHSYVSQKTVVEDSILEILKQEINEEDVVFYLGGYGDFDSTARSCCLKYKMINPKVKLFFITPYLDDIYLKNRNMIMEDLDGSIYPEIESTPKRFAISARNKWMAKQADLIICYVNHSWGGASSALKYAQSIKKRCINIFDKSNSFL